MISKWSRSSQRQITATDVEIRPLLWKSMSRSERTSINVQLLKGGLIELNSLQFDPAPRKGDPNVQKRVPDYFL